MLSGNVQPMSRVLSRSFGVSCSHASCGDVPRHQHRQGFDMAKNLFPVALEDPVERAPTNPEAACNFSFRDALRPIVARRRHPPQ